MASAVELEELRRCVNVLRARREQRGLDGRFAIRSRTCARVTADVVRKLSDVGMQGALANPWQVVRWDSIVEVPPEAFLDGVGDLVESIGSLARQPRPSNPGAT